MKKTGVKTASRQKRSRAAVAAKKPARQATQKRSTTKRSVSAAANTERDALLVAMSALLEISAETRNLLVQIRDALLEEPEELEPAEVDTVVIAEAESPEPSEEEF